ncbi:MAG TPA: hypothetical protein VHU17_09195 [Acidimicrobiales bacterium]|nr:hypothetical protein [Acidimicrobiales bacterium]
MADIFETVIGMAEPALKIVGGFVGEVQATVQKVINNAVAEALKASGAGAAAAAPEAPAPAAAAAGRVRPLRAPGR